MIVGAGLAGLIAGHMLPQHQIYEASAEVPPMHGALLRFRSDAVARATGIEFRRVTVRKGIWTKNGWAQPNITQANLYSQKVLGRLLPRSVWDIAPVERFVAPDDFHERLLQGVGRRLNLGAGIDFGNVEMRTSAGQIVSTIPLPVTMQSVGLSHHAVDGDTFVRAPIRVERFRIPGADVHQTAYFPSPDHSLYRASITGDVLICEYVVPQDPLKRHAAELSNESAKHLQSAFGFRVQDLESLGTSEQRYGKIAPIAERVRRSLVRRLTDEHGIYSLGRFATWRNILLDDVVNDVAVIRRLMASDSYSRSLHSAGDSA